MTGYARSRSGSWLDDPLRRAKLDSSARRQLLDLRYRHWQRKTGPVDTWQAKVDPGGYETRLVTIEFARSRPLLPQVFADGPTDSPHRFETRGFTRLCLWYPSDLPDRRWCVDQGLLALFGLAAHHLFKEGWWRETGEWLGEEAPHGEEIRDLPHDEEAQHA